MRCSRILPIAMLLFVACPGDDQGDEQGDSSDTGAMCTDVDACEVMLATGFYSDEQTCLDWFASGGTEEPVCGDFAGFFDCACDCTGMTPADAEVCLGQCNNIHCS